MKYGYDEILERMNNKFFELSGYEADRVSDIGIRIRLLAGEIFSLSSDIDWIKRQMFPNTATGRQLELHAQQRGLERKLGKKAKGQIMFKLDTPLEYEITVPKGTVCTTPDGSLNFVTSEEVVINRGASFAMAKSEAEKSGTQYNVSPNEITTIVTYFSVGITIQNATSFVGGTDDETDEELRERIMYSMRNIPNGANAEYYISLAESVNGVHSASVKISPSNPNIMMVYINGGKDQLHGEIFSEVSEIMKKGRPLGIRTDVVQVVKVNVSVKVSISCLKDYNFNTVKSNVENSVKEFFWNLSNGEKLTLAALGDVIFHTEGVSDYKFDNMTDTDISESECAYLSDITVSEIGS